MNEQTEQFSECSDAELAALARGGDALAEEALVLRFGWLVRACARPLFLMGGDSEDLVQEGMMGLLAAVREFDRDRGVTFRTYAETCIRNRLHSAVKAAARDKHTPLNSYVPLETALLDGADSDDASAANRSQDDPETLMIRREDMQERLDQLYRQLSPLETRILQLYLSGRSYAEIAQACNRPLKSVDNAVQRIRRKVARQS
ncbi:MAG: sigma-70 family RNA polymerase sigma factor [Oscillospiraceae bacterium]|nr:sigma-70 family RNA polymerase sigma factor [Oscillospiraceae bacterium]